MKVAYLAQGRKYDVWVMCEEDDTCHVLETLQAASAEYPDLVASIMALLLQVVPNEGPPINDPRRAKMLYRDVLYELKADKDVTRKQRVGLRVAFFFDSVEPVVVCAHAFRKSSSSTPETELDIALAARARYFEERDDLEFVVEDLL